MAGESDKHEHEYDFWGAFLDEIWGVGFLAPGGAENVRRTVEGLDLKDKEVLDFGCGAGGPASVLAGEFGARVTAIDIDPGLVARTKALAVEKGLGDRVEARQVEPGPLPFADKRFDAVFSSGVFIHVPDKLVAFKDVRRTLKPGGCFAAYDWLKGPQPETDLLRAWIKMEGLTFHMDHQAIYETALTQAGFDPVSIYDCSAWYQGEARREQQRMQDDLYDWMTEKLGEETREHMLKDWDLLCRVLEAGDLRMSRWRAQNPA